MAQYRFQRRRPRDYPLPIRGMQHKELSDTLMQREIRHARRAGELLSAARGLYAPRRDTTAEQHLTTLEALCRGTPHLVSHHTAASLWGIIQEELAPPFHVTTPAAGSRIKRPGLVTAHRSHVSEADQLVVKGLPITSPARTWVDVALSCTVLEALIYADHCRRLGRPEYGEDPQPLVSGRELEAALHRRGSARGIVGARLALELSREGVDSPQETRLRFYMGKAGFPRAEVNAWIRDEQGKRVVQPDLSIPQYRIAIQYEGWEYHSDPEQMVKDIRRQERTEALGWTEVRITREHMRNGGTGAIAKIRRALLHQGWSP
ncbi:hypothetical protein [Nesterenkonia muleiensis]|uniref:hypothetical protein n=1 Tax=Nesterenkonia muleiensis TaxID=2282648 RepID=UPI003082BECC